MHRDDITRQTVAALAEILKSPKTSSSTPSLVEQNKENDLSLKKKSDSKFGHDQIQNGVSNLDPSDIRKPLLFVEFEGRSAAVLLNRRPRQPGFIVLRFEDDGYDQEVEACHCTIKQLTDATT